MRGAIPPLPQCVFKAWCLVKHMDNFIFYMYLSKETYRPITTELTSRSRDVTKIRRGDEDFKFSAVRCILHLKQKWAIFVYSGVVFPNPTWNRTFS
jgi:hypothetical protein